MVDVNCLVLTEIRSHELHGLLGARGGQPDFAGKVLFLVVVGGRPARMVGLRRMASFLLGSGPRRKWVGLLAG